MYKSNNISDSYFIRYTSLIIVILSIIITAYVLFYPPMPGVADQGDFERVMTVTGLRDSKTVLSQEDRWYKYVTAQYDFSSINPLRLIGVIPTTSMIYPITAARILSLLTGRGYFDTHLLALVYSIIYILSLYICIRHISFKNKSTHIFFSLICILILMDGAYLIWFNSLYGEAMMISGLLLFISSILYYLNNIESPGYRSILFLIGSALLFLGSKMQVFPILPLIILIMLHIAAAAKKLSGSNKLKKAAFISAIILAFYVGGIYLQVNGSCGIDTAYNSLFYGVLKRSPDPEKDLIRLGLSPDLAVDAGKHAYLPKDKYVKYVPWSDITLREFNSKISNFKLLKFYLTQPKRLIDGMEYTASKSFDTLGGLGKYEKSQASEYNPKFNRFTLWSNFRSTKLPKTLLFIFPVYISIFLVSLIYFFKKRDSINSLIKIELVWLILLTGILQFPMPFIGNGEADTAKQLFLFNYTFDMLIIISLTWIFDKITFTIKRMSNNA